MIHVMLVMEDNIVIADHENGKWKVRIIDVVSAKKAEVEWTDQQWCAVTALMFGADEDYPGYEKDKLSSIAEPLFEKLPSDLRLIP